MHVTPFEDPAALLAIATPMLMRREAENCFFLGHLPTLPHPSDAMLWLVRDEDEQPAALALMTPGRHIVITDAPDDAAEALAAQVARESVTVPGVQARPNVAQAFARTWTRLKGCTAEPNVRMAVHELRSVTPPRPAPGAMSVATGDDVPLVERWMHAFAVDIGEEAHFRDGRKMAEQRIGRSAIHLWHVDGQSVSMAACAGATPNGIRVNLVYTPPEFRGRGYASNNVAALSQKLLDDGRRFCFLYTDLANPTSNKIYHDIGYRPVCEDLRIDFHD